MLSITQKVKVFIFLGVKLLYKTIKEVAKRIICIGQIMVDIIFSKLTEVPKKGKEVILDDYMFDVGGGAAISGLSLKRLGFEVDLITSIGHDYLGNFIINQLEKSGIGVQLIKENLSKTNISVELSFENDRITVTGIENPNIVQFQDDFSYEIGKADHLHWAWKEIYENDLNFIKFASDNGLSISMDTDFSNKKNWDYINKILPYTDLVFPNKKEIMGWNGIKDEKDAAKDVVNKMKKNGVCVVKLGEEGAFAISKNKLKRSYGNRTSVTDTTGAGDCFNSGYVFGYLNNYSIERCLEIGNILGMLSVQKIGGFNGVPTKAEILKFTNLDKKEGEK